MAEMLNAYRAGAEMGGAFRQLDEAMHNRAVQSKMDEILRASAERGGDLTMIDPTMYADRVGLEAMGRVAGKMAQTEAWKVKAMQNNAAQARQRFATFQQYFTDIEGAIKDGDQGRTVALMSNMASQSGTPYRFMPTEDGQIRVGFVTPDGELDKGTMTMTEAYDLLKPYATSQDRFVRDSVMYSMATQQENAEIMQNPRRWKQAVDRNGNAYTLVPQRIMKNGQVVSGFLVAGPGGQRNMTLEEVAQAGLTVGGRGMAGGMGATGGMDKNAMKVIETAATFTDESGNKVRNPHVAKVLKTLVQQTGNLDDAMIAMEQVRSELMADPEIAARMEGLSPSDQATLVAQFISMQGGGQREKPAPAQEAPKGEKNTEKQDTARARMKNALAGGGKPENKPSGRGLSLNSDTWMRHADR